MGVEFNVGRLWIVVEQFACFAHDAFFFANPGMSFIIINVDETYKHVSVFLNGRVWTLSQNLMLGTCRVIR